MAVISIILAVIKLLSGVISFMDRRKMIDAGKATEALAGMRRELDNLDAVLNARRQAEEKANADPESVLRDDDGHRRD